MLEVTLFLKFYYLEDLQIVQIVKQGYHENIARKATKIHR